jgi:hypothetical protein
VALSFFQLFSTAGVGKFEAGDLVVLDVENPLLPPVANGLREKIPDGAPDAVDLVVLGEPDHRGAPLVAADDEMENLAAALEDLHFRRVVGVDLEVLVGYLALGRDGVDLQLLEPGEHGVDVGLVRLVPYRQGHHPLGRLALTLLLEGDFLEPRGLFLGFVLFFVLVLLILDGGANPDLRDLVLLDLGERGGDLLRRRLFHDEDGHKDKHDEDGGGDQ